MISYKFAHTGVVGVDTMTETHTETGCQVPLIKEFLHLAFLLRFWGCIGSNRGTKECSV